MLNDLIAALASGKVRVVDLTNKLSEDTPTLVLPEPFKNLIDFSLEKVAEFDEYAPVWRHNNIHTGEHIGTHIDVPYHWVSGKDGEDVSQVPPTRLVGPAVVLDFSDRVTDNPDWLLTSEDVKAWQAEHGEFPENCWVLLRTGWDQYAQDRVKFLNTDENGPHTPGVTAECAEYLSTLPNVTGFGVETVGIDAGSAGGMEPPFPAHYYLLGAGKYGITSLQNLADLPPTGAMIVVAPLPIVGGTGSPSRIFALVEA